MIQLQVIVIIIIQHNDAERVWGMERALDSIRRQTLKPDAVYVSILDGAPVPGMYDVCICHRFVYIQISIYTDAVYVSILDGAPVPGMYDDVCICHRFVYIQISIYTDAVSVSILDGVQISIVYMY